MLFQDRKQAGEQLAALLASHKGQQEVLVLGLARGGVVIAAELAKQLQLPLNVVIPRKIGAPGMPELAIGAIAEDETVLQSAIIRQLGVPQSYIEQRIKQEKVLAGQRLGLYRRHAPLPVIKDKTVILIDDGIATGATMLAAIQAMRKAQAKRIIVAVPVAATDSLSAIEEAADEVVCLFSTYDFGAVGFYYTHFDQVGDEEVIQLLDELKKQDI